MDNLEDTYSSLKEARLCIIQKNYHFANEFYSEALSLMENKVPLPLLCPIYLEYAESLINEANDFFTYSLIELTQQRTTNKEEQEEIEEGLEIAWNMLELCRNNYIIVKDKDNLDKTHTLLGDILALNNEFKDAIEEYANVDQNIKILEKIQICYEFLEDLNNYERMKNKIIKKMKEENKEEEIEEVEQRSEMFKKKMENKAVIEEEIDKEDVIDISNKLRKY